MEWMHAFCILFKTYNVYTWIMPSTTEWLLMVTSMIISIMSPSSIDQDPSQASESMLMSRSFESCVLEGDIEKRLESKSQRPHMGNAVVVHIFAQTRYWLENKPQCSPPFALKSALERMTQTIFRVVHQAPKVHPVTDWLRSSSLASKRLTGN